MIPKKIHYCWFGGKELPKLAQKCIQSWEKFCPDYEIIRWDESNFDVSCIDYTRFTSEKNLYAYLSDYVRLWAVEKYGGFYFDTDVELIRSIDALCEEHAVFSFEGKFVTTGLGFGAEAHHPLVKAMLEAYETKSFLELERNYEEWGYLTGSPKMNTYALLPYGLQQNGENQIIDRVRILSQEYFCPFNDITGELSITDNTYGIHWYMKSANGKWAKLRSKISRPLHRIMKAMGRM